MITYKEYINGIKDNGEEISEGDFFRDAFYDVDAHMSVVAYAEGVGANTWEWFVIFTEEDGERWIWNFCEEGIIKNLKEYYDNPDNSSEGTSADDEEWIKETLEYFREKEREE